MSDFWSKAIEAAAAAEILLGAGHANSAANRAYYAMFNAARAALEMTTDLRIVDIRRHSAVLKLFSQHAVKTGLIGRELSAAMQEAFEVRAVADYDTTSVSREEAREMIALMKELLAQVEPLIQEAGPE
jgi:uncharacterized protein (UPF0332 family)